MVAVGLPSREKRQMALDEIKAGALWRQPSQAAWAKGRRASKNHGWNASKAACREHFGTPARLMLCGLVFPLGGRGKAGRSSVVNVPGKWWRTG